MSIPGKVLIAVLVALAVAGIAAALDPGYTLTRALPIAAAAAVLSVVLSHRAPRMPAAWSAGASVQGQPGESGAKAGTTGAGRHADRHAGRGEGKAAKKAAAASKRAAPRPARRAETEQAHNTGREGTEQGRIKWFDGAKGFGFIIRANGEEIFVHHRSVLGRGRHSLKDGAAVRYRVVNTDKGPQAEDVETA